MKLGLGAAQFGQAYGITNSAAVAEEEAGRILVLAATAADFVDTAAAYGDSEQVVGCHLPVGAATGVITKLPAGIAEQPDAASAVQQSVHRSLERLQRERLAGLLVHQVDDLLGAGGDAVWRGLVEAREQGLVDRIGVSVYSPEEMAAINARFPITLTQLPFSPLDQRFASSGWLARLADEGVEVHARSLFLQGLLLAPPVQPPTCYPALLPIIERFRAACAHLAVSPAAAAFACARQAGGVAGAVVGAATTWQFSELIDAYRQSAGISLDWSEFAVADVALIEPRRWSFTA